MLKGDAWRRHRQPAGKETDSGGENRRQGDGVGAPVSGQRRKKEIQWVDLVVIIKV